MSSGDEAVYRVRTPTVSVELRNTVSAANAPLKTQFASLEPLPVDETPDVRYTLAMDGTRIRLSRDGETIREHPRLDDVMPALEGDLYAQTLAAARAQSLVPLHAAVVVWPEGALVLAGDEGAGKSTVTLALLAADARARYATDDLAFVDADGLVRGFARPVSFDDPPVAVSAGLPPEFTPGEVAFSLHLGTRCVKPCVCVPRGRVADGATLVRAIVLLRHAPHEPNRAPEFRSPAQATAALLRLAHDKRETSLRSLAAIARRIPVHRVVTRDLAGAVAAVMAVFRLGPHAVRTV